jgi:hypothetical protein
VASQNREQLISLSEKDPEQYDTECVKTKFFCKFDKQCLPYWHSGRFIFIVRGGVEGTVLQAGRSRVRFPTVSLEFFIDIFPRE